MSAAFSYEGGSSPADYLTQFPEVTTPDEIARRLSLAGALGKFAGVQLDVMQAWRDTHEGLPLIGASVCSLNCTMEVDGESTGGNYRCGAAVSLNRGVMPRTLATAETMLEGMEPLQRGAALAQARFFEKDGPFDDYCRRFMVAPAFADAIRAELSKPGLQVNIFGGNPELHPEIPTLIRELKAAGHEVHFTTTGGIFMRSPKFLEAILNDPPDRLALSADDFDDADHINRLAAMSLDELKAERRGIKWQHGQRQKAIDAIYTAKLAQQIAADPTEARDFPPILFNMVLHPGNLRNADSIAAALAEHFPGVTINPFPAQSAFYHDPKPALGPELADDFRAYVERMIDIQVAAVQEGRQPGPYLPHLHYWLMLASVFDWAGTGNPDLAMRTISGEGIWRCYQEPAAGRYLQIGRGPADLTRQSPDHTPGGYLDCFWNGETVTGDQQVWDMDAEGVAQYMEHDKQALATTAEHACPGCAFPRLTHDVVATETGMHPEIAPYYLLRRLWSLGF